MTNSPRNSVYVYFCLISGAGRKFKLIKKSENEKDWKRAFAREKERDKIYFLLNLWREYISVNEKTQNLCRLHEISASERTNKGNRK